MGIVQFPDLVPGIVDGQHDVVGEKKDEANIKQLKRSIHSLLS